MKNILFKMKVLLLCLAGTLLFENNVLAEPDYTCWSSNTINAALPEGQTFPSGKAGTTIELETSGTGFPTYSVNCTTLQNYAVPLFFGDYRWAAGTQSQADGSIILNKYLTIKNIWFNTKYQGTHDYTNLPIPSTNINYGYTSSSAWNCPNHQYCISPGPGNVVSSIVSSIDYVRFELVLTKDIYGGAIRMPTIPVLEERLSHDSGSYSSAPTFTFALQGTTFSVPVICTINNGQQINVDFGHIQSDLLREPGQAALVKMTKSVDISCNNNMTQDIDMSIEGEPATFSSQVLATSSPDIGVEIKHNDITMPPNSSSLIHIQDGVGHENLTLSIVKDPVVGTLAGGAFTASAIIILAAD